MPLRAPRPLASAGALALLALVATGCSGDESATDNPPVGVVRSDQVNVLNATLVTDGDDRGTLVASIVNEAPEADTLTDVAITTEDGVLDVVLPDGPVDLPTDEVVRLAPDLRVIAAGDGLEAGFFIEIAYEFENAPTLRDVVPVRFTEAEFSEIEVPTEEQFDDAG